jgi:hypothetical protein
MRRFFLLATTLATTLALIIVGAGFVLSANTLIQPGSALFPVQLFAEHLRAGLTSGVGERAQYQLDVAERRVNDLSLSTGTPKEVSALAALETALLEAVGSVGETPLEKLPEYKVRLAALVGKLSPVLDNLSFAPVDDPERYLRVKGLDKALAGMVGQAVADESLATPVPEQPPQSNEITPTATENPADLASPQVVQFPEGSAGAEHLFFELKGAHSQLACSDCHQEGSFANTPNRCVDCHIAVQPAGHFTQDCVYCHVADDWKLVFFDHARFDVTDCLACHTITRPSGHYEGQCTACHTTAGWLPAHFNHIAAGATDCQGCHDRPSNHFKGQCSACHRTTGWLPANFNHKAAGATDCQGCHKRPAGHFSGQCSACHKPTGWRPASFNHKAAGATDCQGCHKRPAGHYSGQCSNCHTPDGWDKINLAGHSFPINHGNAGGVCSACHSAQGNSVNCFRCHDQAKMETKHAEKGIFDLAGRCLNCHPKGGND